MRELEQIPGAIRAWRVWRVEGYFFQTPKLKALINDHIWHSGPNRALNYDSHDTAGGFYGFNSIDRIAEQERSILNHFLTGTVDNLNYYKDTYYAIGSILCYGKVKIGQLGVRAEYALPEYMLMSNNNTYSTKLTHLANLYGMKPIAYEIGQTLKTGKVPYTQVVGTTDNPSIAKEVYPPPLKRNENKTWQKALWHFFTAIR